jgi:hypothetical protein
MKLIKLGGTVVNAAEKLMGALAREQKRPSCHFCNIAADLGLSRDCSYVVTYIIQTLVTLHRTFMKATLGPGKQASASQELSSMKMVSG